MITNTRPSLSIFGLLPVALAILLAAAGAQAANITWTGSGGNAWNTSTVNWTGTGGATNYTDGDNVRFDETGSSRTVNVASAVSPGSIVVSNSVGTPYMFTNTAIAGTGSLLKDGPGILVLTNAAGNAFSGGVTVNAGTLKLGNTNSPGAGTVTLNGGMLDTSVWPTSQIFTNPIVVNGSATLYSGQYASYNGALTGAGTLSISNLAGGAAAITTTFSSTPNFNGTIDVLNKIFSSGQNGTGSTGMTVRLEAGSSGVPTTLTIARNSVNGVVSIGTLIATDPNTQMKSGGFSLSTVSIGSKDNDSIMAGDVIDSASTKLLALIKVGKGTLTLTGIANSYSGGTTISNGFIAVGGSSALGTNLVTLAGGGLAGTFNGGTISNVINMVSNATFIAGTSSNLTLVGIITNTGALTKTGGGGLTLLATNTYSGATTVSNGVLVVNGATTNSAITVVSGAALWGTGNVGKVTISSNATLSAGDTNSTTVGTLTATNLTLAEGATMVWNYNGGNGDLVTVNGAVSVPTNATVIVTGTGALPASCVLFSGTSLTGATDLSHWTITGSGIKPNMHAVKYSSTQVKLVVPTGFVLNFY